MEKKKKIFSLNGTNLGKMHSFINFLHCKF